MERPIRRLKILAVIFKVLAWGALVMGLVGVVGVLVAGHTPDAPPGMPWMILLASAGNFLILYTVGEVIKLLLSIEKQTRPPQV